MSLRLRVIAIAVFQVCTPILADAAGGASPVSYKARKLGAFNEFGNNSIETCFGKSRSEFGLARLGVTEKQFEDGIDCVPGDFDQNGSIDFLLMGPSNGTSRDGIVLFFNRGSLINSQLMRKVQFLEIFTDENIEKVNYPTYKGKTGLISPGSGDVGHVYFYNKGEKKLSEIPYVQVGEE